MKSTEIRIEPIKVKDILPFAERVIGDAEDGQFIPITMQRAAAHAHNPYASKDDVALLVAIDSDEEVVGYFGILPLLLRNGNEYFKVHWFTTWNVSSKVRGRGVGGDLMAEALTLNNDYLIVGSVHARRVCRKYGFLEREPLPYYWLDPSGVSQLNPMVWLRRGYRKFLRLLRSKKQIEIQTDSTERLAGWLAPKTKAFFSKSLSVLEKELSRDFIFNEVDQLSNEPTKSPDNPEIELHRGLDAINWMLAYPWIVQEGESVTESMDYYFSDARPFYRLRAVEIYSGGESNEYLGYVVFSVSERSGRFTVKTLDYHFSQPSYERSVLALGLRYGKEYDAAHIELPKEMIKYLKVWQRKLLLEPRERVYQCMPKSDDSPLALLWPEISLYLWDGDMAFS